MGIGERLEFRPFTPHRPEEPLHDRVVVAAPGAAHRVGDPQGAKGRLVVAAGLLAFTPQGHDIISLNPPPVTYATAVETAFQARLGNVGTVVFDTTGSGGLTQGRVDTLNGGEDIDANYFCDYVVRLGTSLADAATGGVRAVKIAEGGTVLPQGRVFFRCNDFHNVDYGTRSACLNRFMPGFEKAFFDGLFSIEDSDLID